MPLAVIQRLFAQRLRMVTLLAGALAVVCPYWAPGITWLPLAFLLGGSAVLITRRATGEPALSRLIGASFWMRCGLVVSLFAISSLSLPFLQSLQRGYGMWQFGWDGGGHHEQALLIRDAWHAGIEANSVFMNGSYEYKGIGLVVAMVYVVFGSSPLHFMLVNAWLGAMSGLLAYLLTARLADRRSALAAAGLVAFWPSSMLWSTQLLKDSLELALGLSALLLVAGLWQRYASSPAPPRRSISAGGARWAALVGAVFGFTYFRGYLGTLLTISVALVMAAALGRALWRRQYTEAIVAVAITATVAWSTLLGASVDLYALASPPHPEVGHVRRGDAFREQGEHQWALASYRRAIALNPAYAPAYRALGLMLLYQQDREGAIETLNVYLWLESDGNQRDRLTAVFNRDVSAAATGDAASKPPIGSPSPLQAAATGDAASKPPIGSPSPLQPTAPVSAATATGASSAPVVAATGDAASKPPIGSPSLLQPTAPVSAATGASMMSVALTRASAAVQAYSSFLSVQELDYRRRIQVGVGGTSVIDSAARFNSVSDVVLYLPRAFANAYLSPFPWQWTFTRGVSGIMRPVSGAEVVLIAMLLPAMVIGSWQQIMRFRPESWILILFTVAAAVSMGFLVPNAGTLFRVRLQFLVPSLILASTSLPTFAYRLLDRFLPSTQKLTKAGV